MLPRPVETSQARVQEWCKSKDTLLPRPVPQALVTPTKVGICSTSSKIGVLVAQTSCCKANKNFQAHHAHYNQGASTPFWHLTAWVGDD
jgi:hypothetical protein